jgi:predicted ATP-grasp superfamily ATP-dependent carboligase
LARPDDCLVVALSGRALAVAGGRAGCRVRVLDLFGDTDMRAAACASAVVPGDLERGFDGEALVAAAERLAPAGGARAIALVYGSGFEDRPGLLARLCRGRRLYGNDPETVARTKDPRSFFLLLDRLRIPHPEVSFTMPDDPGGWLVKRAGASGGAHVSSAARAAPHDDCYWQRFIPGKPIGVSFLANGERAFRIGLNEQWTSPGSFRFAGALQPATLSRLAASRLEATLDPLVRALRLVGLNSADAIVHGDEFAILEVNPRPGATLDIHDSGDPAGLFARHLAACGGELPSDWRVPARASAMAIVYSPSESQLPPVSEWPPWVADRPAPNRRIEPGAPVCTVLAAAPTPDAARRLIDERVATVRSMLPHATRLARGEARTHSSNTHGAAA